MNKSLLGSVYLKSTVSLCNPR